MSHESHQTRFSDSSLYDEVCELCGATDAKGLEDLNRPCSKAKKAEVIAKHQVSADWIKKAEAEIWYKINRFGPNPWETSESAHAVAKFILELEESVNVAEVIARNVQPSPDARIRKLEKALTLAAEFCNTMPGWDKARNMQAAIEEALAEARQVPVGPEGKK